MELWHSLSRNKRLVWVQTMSVSTVSWNKYSELRQPTGFFIFFQSASSSGQGRYYITSTSYRAGSAWRPPTGETTQSICCRAVGSQEKPEPAASSRVQINWIMITLCSHTDVPLVAGSHSPGSHIIIGLLFANQQLLRKKCLRFSSIDILYAGTINPNLG